MNFERSGDIQVLISAVPEKKRDYPLIKEDECLAKTLQKERGCSIATHLRVTCKIFRELREIWGKQIKGKWFLPEGEWIAAFHDIGKMTPAFQQKIFSSLNLAVPWAEKLEETNGGHARNSMIILEKECGKELAEIAGAHHGIPQEFSCGDSLDKLGGTEWQKQREALMKSLKEDLQLPAKPPSEKAEKFRDVILGSVILADWLSSSMEIPYKKEPTAEDIRQTIQNAGLIPQQVQGKLCFPDIFGFHENSLQKAVLTHITPGGIYVVESGMGSGKTEAALGLAYSLLEQKKADGIYFALPTQLTSEKIYDRLNIFLEKVLASDDKAMLIHGTSYLQWEIHEPSENKSKRDSWFQSKKRALLASFGAGTLDQALLAILPKVKHNALRAFALTGKVVIMDEIHSYDAYTANLLRKLIGELRKWGCTVILLSATLTKEACCAFAHIDEKQLTDSSYPRILINEPDHLTVLPVEQEKSAEVILQQTADEKNVMQEALMRAENGEQVLWIENEPISKVLAFFVNFTFDRAVEPFYGITLGFFAKKA